MRLDRDARKRERPGIAELAVDHFRAVAATRRTEEAAVRFQPSGRRGEAERRQLRGDDAAFGGATGVKRLGHRPEVLAQAAGLRGGDTQRAPRRFAIEAEQLRGRRGGADRTARRRAVKALLVVARQDRFGNLALDFDADLIRRHQVAAAAPVALRERQHRGQRRCRGMRQQAIDAILRDRELGVVVIVGMDRNAIGERRETGR